MLSRRLGTAAAPAAAPVPSNFRRRVRCTVASKAADASADRTLRSYLLGYGFSETVASLIVSSKPDGSECAILARVESVCEYLLQLGLSAQQVQGMSLRCPRLLMFDLERKVEPAVSFLRNDLGMNSDQVISTLTRCPHVLGLDTKGHLRPHLSYLASLGVPQEELQDLVLCRPHVLAPGIEYLVTVLHKYYCIPRNLVGRLLRSYPFDYRIQVRAFELPKAEQEEDSSKA